MFKSRVVNFLLVLVLAVLCLVLAIPAFAQDDGVIVVPNGTEFGETWGPAIYTGIGQLALVGVVLLIIGLLFLLALAISRLGISVPNDTVQSFTDGLLQTVQTMREDLREYVESTPNPYDNIVYGLGDIPLGALIEEAKKRGLMVLQPDPTGTLAVEPGDPLLHEPVANVEDTKAFGRWREVAPPQEVRTEDRNEASH